jgi:hypothetical protein
MRKFQLFATAAFGAALLAAAPAALAQQHGSAGGRAGAGYGFDAPPGTPLTPDNQGGAGLIPPVGQQYQAARRAESSATDDAAQFLHQADAALARGNAGLANEYMERAETAVLNRDAMAGGADAPTRNADLLRQISEARQALMNRDRAEARQNLRMAMDMTGRDSGMMATGAGASTMPMQGGGGGGSHGMMGSAPPHYGASAGTQAMPGTRTPITSGTQAQGVATVPPVGRGAPSPGQPFPMSGGSSSNLSTGGQIKPGTPSYGPSGGPGAGSGAGGGSGTGRWPSS